jgi:hypothetical protein
VTRQEAEIVANVIGTADSACSVCVSNLVDRLNGAKLGWTFENTKDELVEPDQNYPAECEIEMRRLIVSVREQP